jgi:N-acetylglucosaminyl-diphospho-decaprenol L-rhamnosyltransferase
MPPLNDITAILVSYNTAHLLEKCIGLLRSASKSLSVDIVVIDNASKDKSIDVLKRDFEDCKLITNSVNVGFGRANNQALDSIHSRYVLLLNTDAFVEPDTLDKTVRFMDANPDCGILGVKLIGRDGTLQPSARFFPTPWNLFVARTGLARIFRWTKLVDDMNWDHMSPRSCDWVPGCYYLVRKEVIDQVGLFDPRYFLYYEEVDHCFSAKKAGWEVIFYPDTRVIHLGGESAKSDSELTQSGSQIESLQIESEILYFRKNHGLSGAIANVFLTSLSDLIIPLKRLLKLKRPIHFATRMLHMQRVLSLFLKTRFGIQPTR